MATSNFASATEVVKKILVFGASGVGKSELITSYLTNEPGAQRLRGTNVVVVNIVENNWKWGKLHIQEVDSEITLAPELLRDCCGCVLLFQADVERSVNYALDWLHKVKSLDLLTQQFILVVNNTPKFGSARYWQYTQDDVVERAQGARRGAAEAKADFVECMASSEEDAQMVIARVLLNAQDVSTVNINKFPKLFCKRAYTPCLLFAALWKLICCCLQQKTTGSQPSVYELAITGI